MAYMKKQKTYRIKWKVLLPFLVLVCLIIYFIYGSIQKLGEPKEEKFTICNLSEQKTMDAFHAKQAKETYEVSDYMFYGETLSLFHTAYNPEVDDELSGKTISLYNLCGSDEYSFTADSKIDRQIQLSQLVPGVYQVNITEQLVEKQLVYTDELKTESFYTVPKDGKSLKITVEASKDLLSDYDITMENYVYIFVEEVEPDSEVIDVLIDPYGYNIDYTMTPDEGVVANGLNETNDMYEAALQLKAQLEAAGLRVEITKSSPTEVLESYGKAGRLAKGYEKKAKYYLQLAYLESTDTSERGFAIMHSGQSSSNLASTIVYNMKDSLPTGSVLYDETSASAGVLTSNFLQGMDDRYVYDSNMYIREVGGKATQAALFSETSLSKNGSFAKDNPFGMYGLSVYFAYGSNPEDGQAFSQTKEEMVRLFGESFLEALRVTKSGE